MTSVEYALVVSVQETVNNSLGGILAIMLKDDDGMAQLLPLQTVP